MSRMSKSARIEQWLERLNRFRQSKLTVAEFCQQEEVSLPSFYQWKRRLAPRIKTVRRSSRHNEWSSMTSSPNGFTELVVDSIHNAACVRLSGGITIALGSQPEIAALIVDRVLQHVQDSSPSC